MKSIPTKEVYSESNTNEDDHLSFHALKTVCLFLIVRGKDPGCF